jgi:hypothetical protein
MLVVITFRLLCYASSLNCRDCVHEPFAIGVSEFHSPNLLAGVNDQAIRNPFPELFLNQCTICQVLNHVIGIDLASRRWPIRFFQFDRHNPIGGSDQTVWFSRDAQLQRPQIMCCEWLPGEILIEHFSSGYSGLPT